SIIHENADRMVQTVLKFDAFGVAAAMLVMLIPLGWWLRKDRRTALLLWWTAATIVLYLAGYLLVAFEQRYANAIVFPLILAAGMQTMLSPARAWPRWISLALIAVAAASIAWKWVPLTRQGLTASSPAYMRAIASTLPEIGFKGPFASTSWYHGIALAFCT